MIVKRLKKSKKISDIIVATSNTKREKINFFFKKKKIKVFAGSEANVLSRYYKVAKNFRLIT